MSIPDSQIGLLQQAATALRGWQTAAEGVGVTLQQVVMEFPPEGVSNLVQFTWIPAEVDAEGAEVSPGRFDIATLA